MASRFTIYVLSTDKLKWTDTKTLVDFEGKDIEIVTIMGSIAKLSLASLESETWLRQLDWIKAVASKPVASAQVW